jgi:hypothetical protein
MIIYFSASARSLKKDIKRYRRILTIARSLGHTFTNDWVETAWQQVARSGTYEGIIKGIVHSADLGLRSAEVVIAEVSGVSSFGVGYEVSRAMQERKPILLLATKEDSPNSYASGIENDLVTFKVYDSDLALEKHVEDFLKENTVKNKDLRFNFVLDRQIYNHLRQRSFSTGRTKAEIVRDLLIEDMKVD